MLLQRRSKIKVSADGVKRFNSRVRCPRTTSPSALSSDYTFTNAELASRLSLHYITVAASTVTNNHSQCQKIE